MLMFLCLIVVMLLAPQDVFAGSSSSELAPITTVLQKILDALKGPIAFIIATIAIIVFGLTLAFGGGAGAMRTVVGLVFGLTFALGAAKIITLFGVSTSGRSERGRYLRRSLFFVWALFRFRWRL